ncbi:MAG: hypothetical protein QOH81_1449 [Sphingomonadales bacterium]|jgi:hypothetical protein|nr:hypothetical protein [Sphingomonadales bacterium]
MDKYGLKAALAVSTAAALLAAQPARAAIGCWDQRQAAAAKVRDLQSRLMVATLRCRAMGMDVLTDYNDFVRRNRDTLQGANGLIKAQFDSVYGKDGATYYDRFATGLANHYGGDATNGEVCSDTAAAAREAAGAGGDVGRLLDIADRFGPAPDLPGGACPISFAAAMDHALAAASDSRASEGDAAVPERGDEHP